MLVLQEAPYDWEWDRITPVAFGDLIRELEEQRVTHAGAEADLGFAGSHWDHELQGLVDDAIMGVKLGRVYFKEQPVLASLFEDLRFPTAGRDGRYRQVLAFEKSWQRANAAWVFKPGLALADFRARRKAIRDLEEAHVEAERNERFERARLQHLATTLNGLCVDWYEVATASFAEPTVPGQLIRTVPTTYDPNRPPGPLKLVAQAVADSDDAQLSWRADRGVKFDIYAEGPAGGGFVRIITGATEKRWTLRGLAPGRWRLKGYAENQFGQGKESEVVELLVTGVKAA
jgi:hypothetical protein